MSGFSIFDIFIYSSIGLVFGAVIFYRGFRNLRLKRLIENIPTSKIRSMPMGLVEVIGKALTSHELTTPFSNSQCVFFQYIIEEYRSSGRYGRWVVVKRYTSPLPFKISDGTGEIFINPAGAEVDISTKNIYQSDFFRSIPPKAKQFMDLNGIKYKTWLGTRRQMRLSEFYLTPGADAYVLGEARHRNKSLNESPEYAKKSARKKDLIIDTLKKIKKSPRLIKKYDLNNDGIIDDIEWDQARDDAAKWIDYNLDKEMLQKKTENIEIEIGKSHDNKTFFISDKSQKNLCSRMFWKSSGYVFGGAALMIICAAVLIFRFIH